MYQNHVQDFRSSITPKAEEMKETKQLFRMLTAVLGCLAIACIIHAIGQIVIITHMFS